MTLKRCVIVAGVVSLTAVISEVIRYQGMSEEDRLPYLFGLRSMVACCSIPAVAVFLFLLFFLFDPSPKRER